MQIALDALDKPSNSKEEMKFSSIDELAIFHYKNKHISFRANVPPLNCMATASSCTFIVKDCLLCTTICTKAFPC